MLEAVGIAIVVLIWVISSLVKGFKWLLRRTGSAQAAPPPQAPPRSLAPPPSQAAPTSNTPPITRTIRYTQTPPVRPSAPSSVREQPRQPSAGGPAVPAETSRRDFERQEQELVASEPTALNTALTSAGASAPAMKVNSLFGGTDDLIRAIILQEVLGPPLSRRASSPPPTAPR